MSATPDSIEQRLAAATHLAQSGQTEAAVAALSALAGGASKHVPVRRMLARMLHRLGRDDEALTELDAARALEAEDALALILRSDVLLALGRARDAAETAREALRVEPQRLGAQLSLGLALTSAGEFDEAVGVLTGVLAQRPNAPAARGALVRCLLKHGDIAQALTDARHPGLLDAPSILADVLTDFATAGAMPERAELLRARAERHPDDYHAAVAVAAALHQLGRVSEALPWCERAHRLRPDEREPIEIRAAALIDRGHVEAGLAAYDELLSTGDDAETAARHLVLMHYDPELDNAHLFDAHRAFVQRYIGTFEDPFVATRDADSERALRVGWISPRFGEGPVARFFTGLLGAFDRTRHRHLLIALQPARDAASERLQALADEWIDGSGLDDASLLQRLRELELDVLIDLTGHSTANRLAVIAQRVAPVQVSWLDWFDTTAVPAMDAWITDAWLTPSDSTQCYTERAIRLEAGRFCYTPPTEAPPPGHVGDDTIVFASFNRLAKLNANVVDTWAEILRRVPNSRLQLGTRLLDDPATRLHIAERFAAHGIGADRLDLHGHRTYPDLLAAYRGVDIALDPFPFSGCTTTCDALIMGAAVVTWPGETFVSRQSASLLWRVGRAEWIAGDRAEYVERAVAAAAGFAELRAGRASLRQAVVERLCDASQQAIDFASALRGLWREYCERSPRRV
ncbi:MAG: tetratricopeptide repeat protein [Rhodanobacteraceae bacterium]